MIHLLEYILCISTILHLTTLGVTLLPGPG